MRLPADYVGEKGEVGELGQGLLPDSSSLHQTGWRDPCWLISRCAEYLPPSSLVLTASTTVSIYPF